jgi:RNA polymerase sigma factor (sigma-70 family)
MAAVDGPASPARDDAGAPAVATAYTAYAPELLAYVATRFRGQVNAEDIVHEAFARLVREAAAGRQPVCVRAWLYRVAHNLAVSELRRKAWVAAGDDDHPQPLRSSAPSAETAYDASSVSDDLQRALAALAAPGRRSILMFAEGYTVREIASAVGRTEPATRSLMCRSRKALRSQLAKADRAVIEVSGTAA